MGPVGPTGSIQNFFQAQDNLSKVMGRHTIKVGYHFTDVILTNYFIQRVLGNYEYSSTQQYLFDLTPDVLGERSAGPTSFPTGFLQHEAFINDDFRVRSNLTLNLGLRYEYVTMPIASRYQVYSAAANVPGATPLERQSSARMIGLRGSALPIRREERGWSIRGGFSRAFDLQLCQSDVERRATLLRTDEDVDLTSNAPNFLANGGLPGTWSPCRPTSKGR